MNRLFLILAMWAVGLTSASAATHVVTAIFSGGFRFSPATLDIAAGDTVVWTNLNNFHSVTGDTQPDQFCGNSTVPSCVITFVTPGSYLYHCIPHQTTMRGTINVAAAGAPPSVTLTNPPGPAVFAAPASVDLGAIASDTDGSVTNVEFFRNAISLGSVTAPPYGLSATVPAGSFVLTARATDNQGLSSTSAPVTIRVVERPNIAAMRASNAPIQLSFSTVNGVTYVVQASTELTNWIALATNAGNGALQQFIETQTNGIHRFYRLLLQP